MRATREKQRSLLRRKKRKSPADKKYLQKRNICYNENNAMEKGMRRMVISLRGVPYSAQAFAPRKV